MDLFERQRGNTVLEVNDFFQVCPRAFWTRISNARASNKLKHGVFVHEGAEGPLAVLGNMVKVGIIRQVRRTPNVGRKAIADALEVAPTTIVPYLGELEAAGLLLADPPKAVRKRGEWVVYRVNDEAVTELYLRLGQELGEI
ncbi:ArsR/SmtB family transcription factor [Microbacterium aerolatum]|uniref:ArsR/SmtB family transcription factor n=1 Tax=Microbacterium aerolatum TaxID=153731 RepID=UPI00384C83C9